MAEFKMNYREERMTREELVMALTNDCTQYCHYCGTARYDEHCCGRNHFETFAQMNSGQQAQFLDYDWERNPPNRKWIQNILGNMRSSKYWGGNHEH